jgi:hypothetical protein
MSMLNFCAPGTAVITESKAAMWTDGRYFLQARSQMDDNWLLMKDGKLNSLMLLVILLFKRFLFGELSNFSSNYCANHYLI